MPRIKYAMNYSIKNSFCMSYVSCKVRFPADDLQSLQGVGTKAIGPSCIFTNNLDEINTIAEEEVNRVANMTPNKCVEFQVNLFYATPEATTWSITDMD